MQFLSISIRIKGVPDNIPKSFDWVSARKNCNTREMFKRLLKVVKADCNIAKEKNHHSTLQFSECSEEEFSVDELHASGRGIRHGVAFKLDGSKIQVFDPVPPQDPIPPTKVLYTLQAYLLDGGDCTFVIDDKTTEPLASVAGKPLGIRGLVFQKTSPRPWLKLYIIPFP